MSIDFGVGAPVPGDLDVTWIHGSVDKKRPTDPPIQIHRYDVHTYIFRQSKDVTFEAPFLFLLFGDTRALLLDTGAVEGSAVRAAVDEVIDAWLADHPRERYALVVAHTHAHRDHIAGDGAFADRMRTTVVGPDVNAVRGYFGFAQWPAGVIRFDLGGRVLDVTGIPGHHEASIAVYDGYTGLMFTGDSVLPGRLYVRDMPAFVDSMNRLVEFADSHPVTHVLGCHIEMTRRPGADYYPGCLYQPDEPPLQMTVAQLHDVRDATRARREDKGPHRFDDFILYNGMGVGAALRLNARGLAGLVRTKLRRR